MNTKIDLAYGDKVYDLVVGELTKTQKESLSEKIKKEQSKVVAYSVLKTSFTELTDAYETNKGLLENDRELPIVEKVKLLWEQKKLLVEIKKMRPDVEAKAKEPVLFEEIAREQFDLLIIGEDKASLIKEIDSCGDSYQEVLNTILTTVKKEKEKKSSNS